MDVKHRLGRLVVLAIHRGGAVEQSNALAQDQGRPCLEARRQRMQGSDSIWKIRCERGYINMYIHVTGVCYSIC